MNFLCEGSMLIFNPSAIDDDFGPSPYATSSRVLFYDPLINGLLFVNGCSCFVGSLWALRLMP